MPAPIRAGVATISSRVRRVESMDRVTRQPATCVQLRSPWGVERKAVWHQQRDVGGLARVSWLQLALHSQGQGHRSDPREANRQSTGHRA